MKLRIRNQEPEEQEQVVEVWLEKRGGDKICLMSKLLGQSHSCNWYLAELIPGEGIRIHRSTSKEFGFPLDGKGRLKIIE